MAVDLSKLNPHQREAVLATDGPLLILAGAGSGKTRVLTHRVAHLVIDKNVPPESILAITFTNKATKEMRERVRVLVGRDAGLVRIGTFHRTCLDILRTHHACLDLPPRFTVLGADDAEKVIARLCKDTEINPGQAKSRISLAKNELIDPARMIAEATDDAGRQIGAIYQTYEERLHDSKAVDLDGILTETYRLLVTRPDVLAYYQKAIRYIHVDEYQDTNQVQYQIIRHLGALRRNLMVVGDDDQSIYAFRGADVRIIRSFQREYPDAKVVVLGENYRSTQRIVAAASSVIVNNRQRMPKDLGTSNPTGNPIYHHVAVDEREESRFVSASIQKAIRDGRSPSDIAVLYRVGSLSRDIEDGLLRAGIRYEVVRGTRYLDRKIIRDALAYLATAVNPEDEVSLRRIVNVPRRGFGDATLGLVEKAADQQNLTLREAVAFTSKGGGPPMPAKARIAVQSLDATLENVTAGSTYLGGLKAQVKAMLDACGIVKEAEREDEGAPDRDSAGDVLKLIDIADALAAEKPEATVGDFLDHLALQSEQDEADSGKPSVKLLTVHAAKGLEFPVVFVVGMEEGVFPHSRALVDPFGKPHLLEEERRLAYVAMTRAMQTLVLTNTVSRRTHGDIKRSPESRFVQEIPEDLVRRVK